MPGVRQRLQGSDELQSRSSSSGANLLGLHCRGKLDAQTLAVMARAHAEDHPGETPADVARMASAASTKKAPEGDKEIVDTRNVSRDLNRAFAKSRGQPALPLVEMINIPLWDAVLEKPVDRPVAFLLPHLLLDNLAQAHGEQVFESTEAQAQLKEELESWADELSIDLASGAPVIATGLWGDSAPYSTRDSIHLLILRTLMGATSVKWWVCAVTKRSICRCACNGRHTFNAIFNVLSWSFKAAAAGSHPKLDHLGQALRPQTRLGQLAASGRHLRYRGALLSVFGDWAWFKQVLGLCGWRGEGPSKRVCWKCHATLGDPCPCFDFREEALWRRSPVGAADFSVALLQAGEFASAIWGIPGLHVQHVRIDWMHVSCLGVVQHVSGNIVWELFAAMGGTQQKSASVCGKLLSMMRSMARELGTQMPITDLTIGMFRQPGKSPKMKLKAAEGRNFLILLRKVLVECFPAQTQHETTRLACIDNLCNCYHELKTWNYDGTSTRALARYGKRFLLLYMELRNTSDDERFWKLVPKFHMFAHLAAEADMNPRDSWNYEMESMIGDAASIASRCNVAHLQTALMKRYTLTWR